MRPRAGWLPKTPIIDILNCLTVDSFGTTPTHLANHITPRQRGFRPGTVRAYTFAA